MNTTLTIKTDKALKGDAQKVAEILGVPLTTIINAMLRQFVRDKEITLSAYQPNATTYRALSEAESRQNLETYNSFDHWRRAMRSL